MTDRPTRVRPGVKPGQPRATKTNRKNDKDAAMDRARCTEIAMLAAARGWGKKRSKHLSAAGRRATSRFLQPVATVLHAVPAIIGHG